MNMSGNKKPAAATAGRIEKGFTQGFYLTPKQATDTAELLQYFAGVRQSGNGFLALCPAHDDRKPSLSITPTHDRLLLYCFAGCSVEQVVAAVGLSLPDLFLDANPSRRVPRIRPVPLSPSASLPRRVAVRDYRETNAFDFHNAAGQVIAVKRRYDFTAIYDDGSEREEKTFAVSPSGLSLPLYCLPAVLSAVRKGWRVYLAEGEAKADILNLYFREEWGTEAVASSYGGHWRHDMAATLTGANVVLLPDRDDAGQHKAARVIRDLYSVAASIALCDLSELLTALQAGESAQ